MTLEEALLDREHTICVATGNAHKLDEIRAILSPVLPEMNFVALGELGDFEDPIEDGESFFDNALIKALAALEQTGLAMAVADDSGLCVDALDGAPGIHSARWAGVHGDDAANNAKLLRELDGLDESKRRARFHSTVVFAYDSAKVLQGNGDCEGQIGFEGRGSNGFGYDPLFLPDDMAPKTMAELTPQEKNSISHRYHALCDLAEQLRVG